MTTTRPHCHTCRCGKNSNSKEMEFHPDIAPQQNAAWLVAVGLLRCGQRTAALDVIAAMTTVGKEPVAKRTAINLLGHARKLGWIAVSHHTRWTSRTVTLTSAGAARWTS